MKQRLKRISVVLREKCIQTVGAAALLAVAVPGTGRLAANDEAVSGQAAYPAVEIAAVFEPPGESNVRSSFRLAEGVGLIGTEETGDIYKTTDGGLTWRKVWDGGEVLGIADVRNFIRARDGCLYITTTEPATITRSCDDGETWEKRVDAPGSRTVGLVELDNGVILAGLRRAEAGVTSLIRSADGFASFAWVPVEREGPRQNVTCFLGLGGGAVLAGVGYEGSGKVYKSSDYGLTWRRTGEFPEARDQMNFFRAGESVYVLASGIATLFRSDDEGETWVRDHRFWAKGFLGQCVTLEYDGRRYWIMSATDQTRKPYRHVVLISSDPARGWQEWIELGRDETGGASNLAVLAKDTILVGTGNHAAQGRVYTLRLRD